MRSLPNPVQPEPSDVVEGGAVIDAGGADRDFVISAARCDKPMNARLCLVKSHWLCGGPCSQTAVRGLCPLLGNGKGKGEWDLAQCAFSPQALAERVHIDRLCLHKNDEIHEILHPSGRLIPDDLHDCAYLVRALRFHRI